MAKSNIPASVPLNATASSSATAAPTPSGLQDYFSLKRRTSVTGQDTSDDFSGWAGPGSKPHSQDGSPSIPGVGLMGKLRNFGMGKSISRKATTDTEASSVAPSSTLADGESTEVARRFFTTEYPPPDPF